MNYVFTSDWHLRNDVPRCRQQTEEEWQIYQLQRIYEIVNIANRESAALVLVGDIFHRWNINEFLLNGLIGALMQLDHYALIMRGNHDMKQRSSHVEHTAFGTLQAYAKDFGKIRMAESELAVLPYGKSEKADIKSPGKTKALLIHQLCFPTEKDIPKFSDGAVSADYLMRKFDEYDFIVCGDGHTPFSRGFVINCGSTTQQNIDENHEPVVWLVKEAGMISRIPLSKDLTEIVEDSYTKTVEERKSRFEAFAILLETMESSSLSWEDALRFAANKADAPVGVKQLLEDILEATRG